MTAGLTRPVFGRVSVRFAIVLAIALLPLAIAVVLQTRVLEREVAQRSESALTGKVLRRASGQVEAILRVQGMLAAMAVGIPDDIADNAACASFMWDMAARIPQAAMVAFVPETGLMTCSSTGQTYDYSDNPLFQSMIAAQVPDFIAVSVPPLSGTSILGISEPVFGPAGDYLGYVFVALAHDRLEVLTNGPTDDTAEVVNYWTFSGSGEVMSSTTDLDDVSGHLPAGHDLIGMVGRGPLVFRDVAVNGQPQVYSVVPLVAGGFYLMGSWDDTQQTWTQRLGLDYYLFPILMWAVGMVVAIWAGEFMVTRHLRALTTSITRFARGDRRQLRIDMTRAPIDFREIAKAYMDMTDTIMRGEAELEDTIHHKEVLLREVHHRVKNNLQLIASIMNMQMRKAIAPEARGLLKGLHDRVMSLATIHRGLYQTTGLVDVRADELFGDLVRQIVNMSSAPDRRIDAVVDLDKLVLTPDQVVPLSLLLTEALTNAIKYGGTVDGTRPRIDVSLKGTGPDSAILEIRNRVGVLREDDRLTSTGLGGALLAAFAQQLGGTLEQTEEGEMYRLTVQFRIIPHGQEDDVATLDLAPA